MTDVAVAPTATAPPRVADPVTAPQLRVPREHRRLVSLDAVRGLAVVGMLLVNNRGSAAMPRQLMHAGWFGMTVADLVFPLFLFVVGVAMPFSARSADGRAVLVRAVKLVVIGSLLVSAAHRHLGPSTGVLQHIAIAYLAAWTLLRLPRRLQLPACVALLGAVWAAFAFASPPGVVAGSWGPGDNISAYVDRVLLGSPAREGLLPALVSTVNVMAGVAAGRILRAHGIDVVRRMLHLAASSALAGAGLLLAGVPVSKPLWSPSYALLTIAASVGVVTVAYLLVDRLGFHRPARPLVVLGANAIAVYAATELLFAALLKPWQALLVRPLALLGGDTFAAVAYAAVSVVLGWLMCAWMYRRRLFVKI